MVQVASAWCFHEREVKWQQPIKLVLASEPSWLRRSSFSAAKPAAAKTMGLCTM